MFDKDYFMSDKTGRYEYETLFFYDIPIVFARYDTAEKKLQVFAAPDSERDEYVAVTASEGEYQRMKNDEIYMYDFMKNCTEKHYVDFDMNYIRDYVEGECLGVSPNCYLHRSIEEQGSAKD